MSFRFEGLEIFHAAIDFTLSVREMARKFPLDERFDLTSQARRAANSIVLNIAEGSGRGTKKDFSHFLDMALGLTFETVACFYIAERYSYISKQELEKIKTEGESLGKRINAFKGALKLQIAWPMADSLWHMADSIWLMAYGKERAPPCAIERSEP